MHWLLIALAPVFPMLPAADAPRAEEEPAPAAREEIWTELPSDDAEEGAEGEEEEAEAEPEQTVETESAAALFSPAVVPHIGATQVSGPQVADPEFLIGREPTAAAWRQVRNRLQTHFNGLREGMRLPYDAWDVNEALEKWLDDVDLFAEYAVALAAEDISQINRQVEVLELLTDYLAMDYESGNPVRIEATMRQIDQLLQRMEETAVGADARAGRVDRWGYAMFPPDWGEPRFRDRMFSDGLTFHSAAELSAMSRERHYYLSRAHPDRLESDTEPIARELVELARALGRRQAELPDLSREGFRNGTMRMEVIAENIVEFSRARDRHGYNRQVFLMGETLRTLDGFLQVSEATRQ